MKNLDVRIMVSESHIQYRDIAKKMGISPTWLSTLMRHDLSPVARARIIDAIVELKNDQNRS